MFIYLDKYFDIYISIKIIDIIINNNKLSIEIVFYIFVKWNFKIYNQLIKKNSRFSTFFFFETNWYFIQNKRSSQRASNKHVGGDVNKLRELTK